MKHLKKGLIIQGPIISTGRTGKTANITFKDVKEEHVVDFNCIENIAKIFNDYQYLFDHIVCITWENQELSIINELRSLIPDECLIIIKDTTERIDPRGSVIPGNNKYRQFLSIYEGSKILSQLGCKYIAKVRSDQFLDLDLLMNDAVTKLANEKRNVILVPWISIKNSYSIFEIPDHYFVARTNDMLGFSEEYLSLPEITDHIHTDVFYKWSMRSYCNSSLIRFYITVFNRFGNNSFMRILINPKFSKGFFIPLNPKILQSIFWRGESWDINNFLLSNKEIDYSEINATGLRFVLKKIYNKIRS